MAKQSLQLPDDYADLMEGLKRRVASAQLTAKRAVNQEQLTLYWDIGQMIIQRQQDAGWGNAVVEQIATDLRASFPDVKGSSRTNVFRMRAFYLAYSRGVTKVPQAVGQALPEANGAGSDHKTARVALPVRQIPSELAIIPWGHNVSLIEKVQIAEARLPAATERRPGATTYGPFGKKCHTAIRDNPLFSGVFCCVDVACFMGRSIAPSSWNRCSKRPSESPVDGFQVPR